MRFFIAALLMILALPALASEVSKVMDPKHTARVLIGYQNDYFSSDGILVITHGF